jgi:hypothetical protein
MPIAEFKSYNKTDFRKNEFIDLAIGTPTIIRILNEHALVVDTHYSHGATIACPGEDCPICQNNRKMFLDNGRDAYKLPGFISLRQVGYLNVLDRTPVKLCPNTECKAEIKKVGTTFPASCPKCGASLISVKASPLNKVKILSKGKKFYEQLDYYNSAILDENETPIGITNYDLELLVLDNKTAPTVRAMPERNDVVEVVEEELFDLSEAQIHLNPSEINDLLRGTRLADIFAARRSSEAVTEDSVTTENKGKVNELLNDLFSN